MCGGGGGGGGGFCVGLCFGVHYFHNMKHTHFSARVSYFVHFVHFLLAHTVLKLHSLSLLIF